MFHAPTPIAATAIIAQITSRGDCHTCYADVGGVEHEFEAWFRVEWERVGEYGRADYDEATCTLVGAYAYDDDGLVWFAGNRSELAELIGETAVDRWEADMSERKTEAGGMTGHLREFWITVPEEGRGPYGIVHTSDDGIHKPGFIHVREVPQPRTLYLCEVPGGIPSIYATAIDATKAALAIPGATVSEWREVLS